MQETLNSKKKGDVAFRHKDFRAAIECYTQVKMVNHPFYDFFIFYFIIIIIIIIILSCLFGSRMHSWWVLVTSHLLVDFISKFLAMKSHFRWSMKENMTQKKF